MPERDESTLHTRYQLLVENATDVVFHSIEGVLLWISPSITQLAGWSQDDLIGSTTAHLWHPDDLPQALSLRDATYRGAPSRGLLRFRRQDA